MIKQLTYMFFLFLLTTLAEFPLSGQEVLVEEMTAAEHLCPFIEFDPLEYDVPDPEIDYEWEMDMHEIL